MLNLVGVVEALVDRADVCKGRFLSGISAMFSRLHCYPTELIIVSSLFSVHNFVVDVR
jgi:hypothetical protein